MCSTGIRGFRGEVYISDLYPIHIRLKVHNVLPTPNAAAIPLSRPDVYINPLVVNSRCDPGWSHSILNILASELLIKPHKRGKRKRPFLPTGSRNGSNPIWCFDGPLSGHRRSWAP